MKRVITNTTKPIEVVINIDCIENIGDSIAASIIEHPKNIKKRKRLSEIKLGILNDIVEGVIGCIKSYNFPILQCYQSKRSYSYYVTFQPVDDEGNTSAPIPIKFRMSDHCRRDIENADPQDVIILSVKMGDYIFENRIEFQIDFSRMCKGLAEGKLSSIDIMNKYT